LRELERDHLELLDEARPLRLSVVHSGPARFELGPSLLEHRLMAAQGRARRLQVPASVGQRRLQPRPFGLLGLELLAEPPLALEEQRRVLLLGTGERVGGQSERPHVPVHLRAREHATRRSQLCPRRRLLHSVRRRRVVTAGRPLLSRRE